MPATSLDAVPGALSPQPLNATNLEEYFVETAAVRDAGVRRRGMIQHLLQGPNNPKVLLAGQRGCGKSTELAKFLREFEADWLAVSVNTDVEGLLHAVSVPALLVIVLENVLRRLSKEGIDLDEQTLADVYRWFSQTTHIDEEALARSVELGVVAKFADSWLGKLVGITGVLKHQIKSSAQSSVTTVFQEERRVSELVAQCSRVLKDARVAVQERKKKQLLIVVEALDRMSIQDGVELLLTNPALLGELSCKMVLTAPMALYCHPQASRLSPLFGFETLPNVKVTDQAGAAHAAGVDVLRAIVGKRLSLALIDDDALRLAIQMSGGILRHLFEALTYASFLARDQKGAAGPISREHVRYGLNRVKSTLLSRISTVGLPEEYAKLVTDADLQAAVEGLVGTAAWQPSTAVNLLLIEAQVLLEYSNGERWFRLHPLVEEAYRGRAR